MIYAYLSTTYKFIEHEKDGKFSMTLNKLGSTNLTTNLTGFTLGNQSNYILGA